MPPVIAVVGATATGKTALAVELARRLEGEIINADSRQVYRGMDIGTAKPDEAERRAARHWLIDVADPGEQFTLARFLDLAHEAIVDINERGKRAIIAGGTAQYVWALLEGWRVPRVPPDRALRARLEQRAAQAGSEAVWTELREIDPAGAASIDARNARRVIRAIEVTLATGRPFSAWRQKREPLPATIIGLRLERGALYRRIDERVDRMVAAGLLDEVRGLVARGYGCDLPSMSGIGYRQMCEHLSGDCSLEDAVARTKTATHRLARQQHTWFRNDEPRITWFDAAAPDVAAAAMRLL